jgi:hypothetical protein
MGLGAGGWFGVLAATCALAACQITIPRQPPTGAAMAGASSGEGAHLEGSEGPPTPIAWASAGDCLGQLRLLHAAAAQGRLQQSHAPPFAVAPSAPTTSLEWVRAPAVPIIADLPLESYEDREAAAVTAPCLLQVEAP